MLVFVISKQLLVVLSEAPDRLIYLVGKKRQQFLLKIWRQVAARVLEEGLHLE